MNTSKENLLNIANVIIGSSCDTAANIADIIERGLVDDEANKSREKILSLRTIIGKQDRELEAAIITIVVLQKKLDAVSVEAAENSRNVTLSQNEIIRLRKLLEEGQASSKQLQLTAAEAISDASDWKKAARQTQKLLDQQTQETESAMDRLKEVEADSEDLEHDLRVELDLALHSLSRSKPHSGVVKERDSLEQELIELRAAHRGSEKQVKELGELVNQTKVELYVAKRKLLGIYNIVQKP